MNLTFFLAAVVTAGLGQDAIQIAGLKTPVDSIADQFADAERLLASCRADLQARGERFNPDGYPESMFTSNEKLMTLESIVTELKLDALGKQALWEQVQNMTPESMPTSPELQVLLDNDRSLAAYEGDLRQLEESLGRARQRCGNKHREVIQLEQQYQVAKQRLEEETTVKTLIFNNQQISRARHDHLRSCEMLSKAEGQLCKIKSERMTHDRRLAAYLRLVNLRDTLRLRLLKEINVSQFTGVGIASVSDLVECVSRTSVELERAMRSHADAVAALNSALAASRDQRLDAGISQPGTAPAGD